MNTIMNENDKNGSAKRQCILLIASWMVILAWRLYYLIVYAFNYVDEDSSISWIGTARFAHGQWSELFYIGQDYNVMAEAILATPLYLCGWPLNYALPLATMILGIFPFLFCSIYLWKQEKRAASLIVTLCMGAVSWRWDLFTSIPRALIGGLAVALPGAVLLNDPKASVWKRFIGAFLCGLGVVMNYSAAPIVGLALAWFVMAKGKDWKVWGGICGGFTVAALIFIADRIYFKKHAADYIGRGVFHGFSFSVVMENLRRVFELLDEEFLLGRYLVPLVLVLLLIFGIWRKKIKYIIMFVLIITGNIFAMGWGWTLIYDRGGLMFGQGRFFLYWTLIPVLIIALTAFENDWQMKKACFVIPAVLLLMVCSKGVVLSREMNREGSELMPPGAGITVMSVESIKRQSDEMVALAEYTGSSVLVTTSYARVFAHAASALHYDSPVIFYIPDRERRQWVYNDLAERKGLKLILYSLPVREDMQFEVIELGEKTVPEYFEELTGYPRGFGYIWGIRGELE